MDTADAIALALAGLAVLIGASIAAVVVLRPPTRRDHPPSTMPGHSSTGEGSGADQAHDSVGPDTHGEPSDATTASTATTTTTTISTTTDTTTTTPPTPVSDTPTPSPLLSDPTPPTAPRIPTGGDARAERDEGVSVAILVDEDGNHRWRVSLSSTSDPITIDVFSFRAVGSNGEQPWQHELLISPMDLEPGHAKSIGGPVDPTVEYTVSIAWIAHHPDGDTDTTRLLHIPVSEIRTWGLNSAVSRARRPHG